MRVTALSSLGYRNLQKGRFTPSDGMNVIYGDNGQGKTNLIEALWLFSGAKSFRGARDAQLLAFGEDRFQLELSFFAKGRDQTAKITYNGTKKAALNGVPLGSAADFAGQVCALVFSPSHMPLVKDGPGQRRKFLDTAIGQLRPKYIGTLTVYNRALSQRNALLRDVRYHSELYDMLDLFEEKMADAAEQIVKKRRQFIDALMESAPGIYAGISGGKERFAASYLSSAGEDTSAAAYREALKAVRGKDMKTGVTSIGPHRDDLELLINGVSARVYGSQGQQRSGVLALKLSEGEIYRRQMGEQPIALLDDVMSELDPMRQSYIMGHIGSGQVFITCCDPASLLRASEGKIFKMEKGAVTEEKGR